eukprot:1125895-Rhodomonas_salina.1
MTLEGAGAAGQPGTLLKLEGTVQMYYNSAGAARRPSSRLLSCSRPSHILLCHCFLFSLRLSHLTPFPPPSSAGYYVPIAVFLSGDHPMRPPICKVKPTPEMMIKPNHQHVDVEGIVCPLPCPPLSYSLFFSLLSSSLSCSLFLASSCPLLRLVSLFFPRTFLSSSALSPPSFLSFLSFPLACPPQRSGFSTRGYLKQPTEVPEPTYRCICRTCTNGTGAQVLSK